MEIDDSVLVLKRYPNPKCTPGALYYNGVELMKTIELPYINNEKNVSCVPVGAYGISPYISAKYPGKYKSDKMPYVYALNNINVGVKISGISQRTHILIHVLNFIEESQGCIGVGTHYHSTRWGVSNSRKAFEDLFSIVRDCSKINKLYIIN